MACLQNIPLTILRRRLKLNIPNWSYYTNREYEHFSLRIPPLLGRHIPPLEILYPQLGIKQPDEDIIF